MAKSPSKVSVKVAEMPTLPVNRSGKNDGLTIATTMPVPSVPWSISAGPVSASVVPKSKVERSSVLPLLPKRITLFTSVPPKKRWAVRAAKLAENCADKIGPAIGA